MGLMTAAAKENSADSIMGKLLAHQDSESALLAEIERQTELGIWKSSRVDVVLHHELFNLVDGLLETYTLQLEQAQLL